MTVLVTPKKRKEPNRNQGTKKKEKKRHTRHKTSIAGYQQRLILSTASVEGKTRWVDNFTTAAGGESSEDSEAFRLSGKYYECCETVSVTDDGDGGLPAALVTTHQWSS